MHRGKSSALFKDRNNMNENDSISQSEIMTLRVDESLKSCGISTGLSSIVGTRKNQQDSLYVKCDTDKTIAIICDGMGGMEGGELASQLAVRILAEDFEQETEEEMPAFFQKEAVKMDDAIASLVNEAGEAIKAGTTVVSVVIKEDKLYWLSVGDSRIYIIRGAEIVQINQDHNYKLLLDTDRKAGKISEEEYIARIGKGEALISYLGIGKLSLIDINYIPFQLMNGDVILLCSDGLYKRLDDQEIYEIIQAIEPDMNKTASELTRIVMEKTFGSQDNTSVILMQYNQYSNK